MTAEKPANSKKKTPAKKAPVKKTTTAKPRTKKPSSASSAAPLKKSWFKWLIFTSLKLAFVVFVAIGIYAIYLDGKVRATFEGQRWQVPVQVFGQIETLTKGSIIDLAKLRQKLEFSGYRKVSQVQRAGEFAMSASRIIIFQRPFDFGSGLENAAKLTIDVEANNVAALYQDEQTVSSLRLEPVFIDRILPESKEDRVLVALENVPQNLLDTLLLVEDRDFYFHRGVSVTGIARALVKNIVAGRTVQGGSTLTQQLVKNMFLTREKTLTRKVNEALMALILEYRYSKDQLLEAYVNEVYLGQHYANGIYGFGLAANFYFGQRVENLSNAQIAMLIGQVKGPSYYDPWRYPERAKKRRDLILRMMFEENALSVAQFEQAVNSPLSIRKSRRLMKEKHPAYMQRVKSELAQLLSETEQQSGIRVFTGFSIVSQQAAEDAISLGLSAVEQAKAEKGLEAAMVVSDVRTGELRAMVGGRDSQYAGFNRALHASRPIGSLVKPAIYLAALERYEHFNFASVLADKPITLTSDAGKKWQPKNYDGKYQQQVSLFQALVNSLNVPTVNLGMALGLENVGKSLRLLGVEQELTYRPSMLLGAINMSPWQVQQMYLPLANHGNYVEGHAISKVVSAQGETLFSVENYAEPRLSDNGSYLVNYALNNVTKTGTARSLTWRLKGAELAGKTGTSNDQRDSWFTGYDNRNLVTTWVGNDNNQSMKLTGSSGALVLFAEFMKRQGVDNLQNPIPDSIAMQKFEIDSGNAVSQDCLNTQELPAVVSGVVIQPCLQAPAKKKSWLEKLFGE